MDVYVGAGRKRVRKSTGVTDKVQARMIEQNAIAVNRGITTRQRAMAIVDALLPIDEQSLRIEEAAAYYSQCLKDENIILSRPTVEHRINIVSNFAEWAKTNTRASSVEDVDAHTVFAFAQELGRRDISTRTRNAYIGDLITVWKMFCKRSKARSNPWTNARFQRRKEEERHGRAFTDAEIEALMTEAKKVNHQWEEAIVIGIYTGQRESDILNLRWSQVDFDHHMIHFSGEYAAQKTKRFNIEAHIPMHRNLEKMLRDLYERREKDATFVLPLRAGELRNRKYMNGDCPFNTLIERAKIVADDKTVLSFHCFRHTFASRLSQVGVREDVRMRLTGHINSQTHSIYVHDDESGRKAIDLLS